LLQKQGSRREKLMKIKVEVNQEGDTRIKVEGVKGKSCKDLTKAIEEALGTTTADKKTAEYHEREQKSKNKLGLGL
jgi:hypothetical protein